MILKDFSDLSRKYIENIDVELVKALSGDYPCALREAMEYAVFPAGKRVRPLLLLAACHGVGGDITQALPFAAAIELIHSYSLIHDDLPAMDDDDVRRGKPSCHIKYGEALAILAGDGLLNRAFEHMSGFILENPNPRFIRAMREIVRASGPEGMVGGQCADILGKNNMVSEEQISYIHANKTAALFGAALAAGAEAGGSNRALDYRAAGAALGLAFQIRDDLADADKADEAAYQSVFGVERAVRDAGVYTGRALGLAADLCGGDSFLYHLIRIML